MESIQDLTKDVQDFMEKKINNFSFETKGSGWTCYKHNKVILSTDPYTPYVFVKLYIYDENNKKRVRQKNEKEIQLSKPLEHYSNILLTMSVK